VFLTLCLDKARVEVSRSFYQRLGLDFASEQHGDRGLPHYAAVVQRDLNALLVRLFPNDSAS